MTEKDSDYTERNNLRALEGYLSGLGLPKPKSIGCSPSESYRESQIESGEQRNIRYTGGDILEKYEIGDELAGTENGGQGTVFRAKRKEDGLDSIVKIYNAREKGSWEAIFHEEKRAGREIRFLENANADGIPGLPKMIEYGTTGSHIKTPVSVFEPFPGKRLDEEVRGASYVPSLDRLWTVVGGLWTPIEYAHTKHGVKPVVHREINPGNILVNGEPILIDWASSTNPSTGRTQMLRTQMLTQHFSAPEVILGNEVDVRADIYGLGKVGQYMILGADVFKAAEGMPTQRDFKNMNIPKEVFSVLEKATRQIPEERYKKVSDFYDSLEKAVKGRSLPVRVGTKGLEGKVESVGLTKPGATEAGVVGTVAGVAGVVGALGALGAGLVGAGLVGAEMVGTGVAGVAGLVGAGMVGTGVAGEVGLSIEKQDYHAKRGIIYGAVGAVANIAQALFLETSIEQKMALGAGIQAVATLIGPAIIIGKHYLARRRDVAELEARVSQGLEKKVEDVELTQEEKEKVSRNFLLTCGGALATSLVIGMIGAFDFNKLVYSLGMGGIGGTALSIKPIYNHLQNRALKQKRLTAGLPAEEPKPEMREYIEGFMGSSNLRGVKKKLLDAGFKKKMFRNKFVGNGVELSYNKNSLGDINYSIKTTSGEKAREVYDNLDAGLKGMIDYLGTSFGQESKPKKISGHRGNT